MQARQKLAWPEGERQLLSFGFDMQITQDSSLGLLRMRLNITHIMRKTFFLLRSIWFLGNCMGRKFKYQVRQLVNKNAIKPKVGDPLTILSRKP
jgi:hypothetical protein